MGHTQSFRRATRYLAPALAIGLVVWIAAVKIFTRHVWEDFFITYRHSENLVNKLGLVYQAGERVHGFTSPLNVLVPALFLAAQPSGDYEMPLWGFSILALAVLALGVAERIRSLE